MFLSLQATYKQWESNGGNDWGSIFVVTSFNDLDGHDTRDDSWTTDIFFMMQVS